MTRSEPKIMTFGCRLNIQESEVIRAHVRAAGLENVIVFNTCSVTGEAERQARQAIRRARREHPDARIVVTGCAAQIDPQTYVQMPEVDQVMGNDQKLLAESWIPSDSTVNRVNDIMAARNLAPHLVCDFPDQTRAFVQVQNGCDHRCTFCVIPYGRGGSRSLPVGAIAEQVRMFALSGFQEVVMTGVDLTSYGRDLPGSPSLGQMIRRVLALVPEMPRLRLSSLDPAAFDPDLWSLIAQEPRFMPHLHLSVQAGDDLVLKRMKRRHLRADLVALCRRARSLRPEVLLGADLIAGFPTETEETFLNTLNLIDECDLTFLHVFPYSARKGTPAARMPQVPLPVRKERAGLLREKGKQNLGQKLVSQEGRTLQVLSEKGNAGHSDTFLPVRFVGDVPAGHIMMVSVLGVRENALSVEPALS